MLRPEYDRFIEICKEELPPTCFLQTFDSDEDFCFLQAKIRRSDTTAIQKKNWKSGLTFNQGIFVDVFPFDNIPNLVIPRVWHYAGVVFFERVLKRRYNYKGFDHHTLKGRIFKMMVDIIFALRSPDKVYASCENLLKKYSEKNTKFIGELTTIYRYKRSRRERVLYDELIDHQFEDRVYKIPKRYEEILNLAYGDWRTPKPQAPTLHGTTYFDPYNPYTDYLEGKRTVDFERPL